MKLEDLQDETPIMSPRSNTALVPRRPLLSSICMPENHGHHSKCEMIACECPCHDISEYDRVWD